MSSAAWANVPLYVPTLADLMVKRKEAIDRVTRETFMRRDEAERLVDQASSGIYSGAFVITSGGRRFGKAAAAELYRERYIVADEASDWPDLNLLKPAYRESMAAVMGRQMAIDWFTAFMRGKYAP